ncbi:MAG: hypothetical protein KKE44_12950, partial [Proteobacteria bacterium]|nr:hypothetical protein [Pseudomonadota bacterium]MBU1583633.1 hypothetical protein [Pseudomonadota bacterium]
MRKKDKNSFFIKTFFIKIVIWVINKINFEKIAQKIALSSAGKDIAAHFANLPKSWEAAEKISTLAAELT